MKVILREVKNTKARDNRIKRGFHTPNLAHIKHLGSVNGVNLNLTDRTLYNELVNDSPFYIKERGYYAPPMQTVSDEIGVSLRQVNTSMKKLVECGLVIVLNRKLGCTNELGVVRLDGTVIQPEKGMQERMKQIDNHKGKPKNDIDDDDW